MDNSAMKPSDIFYGTTPESAESDATSTTDEVVTETLVDETTPAESEVEVDELETEESEAEGKQEEGEDNQDEGLYIDLDGEEVSLDDIKSWKSGHMMQADYTRGKQEVAKERTALEADRAEMANQSESLKTLAAELEAVIGSEDEVDMNELREIDPDEYIKLTERNANRKELLSKAKESFTATKPVSDADVTVEREQLIKNNPQWVGKDGKATDVYKSDMAALDTYLGNNGWTAEEFATVYQSKHVEALIKAAKYDELQGKKKAIAKKVRKAPIVKRGKSTAKVPDKPGKSAADIFYSKT